MKNFRKQEGEPKETPEKQENLMDVEAARGAINAILEKVNEALEKEKEQKGRNVDALIYSKETLEKLRENQEALKDPTLRQLRNRAVDFFERQKEGTVFEGLFKEIKEQLLNLGIFSICDAGTSFNPTDHMCFEGPAKSDSVVKRFLKIGFKIAAGSKYHPREYRGILLEQAHVVTCSREEFERSQKSKPPTKTIPELTPTPPPKEILEAPIIEKPAEELLPLEKEEEIPVESKEDILEKQKELLKAVQRVYKESFPILVRLDISHPAYDRAQELLGGLSDLVAEIPISTSSSLNLERQTETFLKLLDDLDALSEKIGK